MSCISSLVSFNVSHNLLITEAAIGALDLVADVGKRVGNTSDGPKFRPFLPLF
ncbi:hypothetical protein [Vibrio gallaecicus]|uniref:hypothetical protein n=1 Tax=Vibrio gallaecicus TaxID=552386 RepID=UPI0025B39D70|nr:hypothetical protein [Vibrio gallaecicus]MDN3614665.1 hypothetical protein [Vibrio gallaecicus]MDN3615702.1 hypothetical protein [Vibrio gallaecicus]MDN3615878.1 hypothetical protein [Vibrio gallaecicus]